MRTFVTRSFTFEAAHRLPWHSGKCRDLHGHGYRLEVAVEGPIGPQGIVVDFADVAEVVEREVIARYDHVYLNDLMDNPTAELLAHDICKRLDTVGLGVVCVRLWETDDCMVEVTND